MLKQSFNIKLDVISSKMLIYKIFIKLTEFMLIYEIYVN